MPERPEQGTSPFADFAGVAAASTTWPRSDPAATGTCRQRVLASMAAAEVHELEPFGCCRTAWRRWAIATSYGKAACRTATAYFTVAGIDP